VLSLLLIAGVSQTPAQQARLSAVSKARGAFERNYVTPRSERLQVIEGLGTSGLGNPGRSWYFPAGSASHRVWIVTYGEGGALVYQSWRGKKTTTDWVLDLADGRRGAQANGTVSRMIADLDMRVKGRISPAQQRVLNAKRAYVGMTEGRGPYQGELYTWFEPSVAPRTRRSHWWRCDPSVAQPNGSVTMDMGRVLYAPPILPEEARLMGVRLASIWKGSGKYKAELVPVPGSD